MSEFSPAYTSMANLNQLLEGMLAFFNRDSRCLYIDYPLHRNVGDLLINAGNEQFFHDHEVNIYRRYSYYDFFNRISHVQNSDTFLLHGGGNFGDLYPNFQSLREQIMEKFPNNRIILLPQTVHFTSDLTARKSIARMRRHNNFHVFARDQRSLDRLRELGLHTTSLMPDTAHALLGKLPTTSPHTAQPGTLRFLRRDCESAATTAGASVLLTDARDWTSGTFSTSHNISYYAVAKLIKLLARYGSTMDLHRLWYWQRDKLIQDGVSLFSNHAHIITDRLHAMILALLLNREVTAIDNDYGKLSAYYQSWLTHLPNLTFVAEATEIERLLRM